MILGSSGLDWIIRKGVKRVQASGVRIGLDCSSTILRHFADIGLIHKSSSLAPCHRICSWRVQSLGSTFTTICSSSTFNIPLDMKGYFSSPE